MCKQAGQLDEGLDFVKSEVRILRIRVESGGRDLWCHLQQQQHSLVICQTLIKFLLTTVLEPAKESKSTFVVIITCSGVERAEKSSEDTASTVKIVQGFHLHINLEHHHPILNNTMISKATDQWKVLKLEKVVEELKEEIWELDTNNRFHKKNSKNNLLFIR